MEIETCIGAKQARRMAAGIGAAKCGRGEIGCTPPPPGMVEERQCRWEPGQTGTEQFRHRHQIGFPFSGPQFIEARPQPRRR